MMRRSILRRRIAGVSSGEGEGIAEDLLVLPEVRDADLQGFQTTAELTGALQIGTLRRSPGGVEKEQKMVGRRVGTTKKAIMIGGRERGGMKRRG